MADQYPTAVSSSIKTWPILQMAATGLLPERDALLDPETRWPLQRAIADVRFKLLQAKIDNGKVGCSDEEITISIQARQRVVDVSATDGKEIRLSKDAYWLNTVSVSEDFRKW